MDPLEKNVKGRRSLRVALPGLLSYHPPLWQMEEVALLRIILSFFRKREMDARTFDTFSFSFSLSSLDHVRLL